MRYSHAFFRIRRTLLTAILTAATVVPVSIALSTNAASAAPLETWERVAACESSGDWSIDTGNGFHGGLQFTPSTWAEFGGHQYALNAHLATKEQQIAVAEKLLARQGPGAWPECSIKAGLTADSPTTALDTRQSTTQEAPTGVPPSSGVFIGEAGDTLASMAEDIGRTWQELYTQNTERAAPDPDAPLAPGTRICNRARAGSTTGPADPSTRPGPADDPTQHPAGPTLADGGDPVAMSSGSAPVDAPITTAYRTPGSFWSAGFHTGSDFAVPTGTPVKAVTSGTVVSAGWNGSYGNAVVIHHDDGLYSLYAHLTSTDVSAGQKTAPGQQVGLSGSTGNSTGPHLHLEIRTQNSYNAHIDPVAYLRGLGRMPGPSSLAQVCTEDRNLKRDTSRDARPSVTQQCTAGRHRSSGYEDPTVTSPRVGPTSTALNLDSPPGKRSLRAWETRLPVSLSTAAAPGTPPRVSPIPCSPGWTT